MLIECEHSTRGTVRVSGTPVKLSEVPDASEVRPAPMLGEHTAEVLASVGIEREELEKLRADGVV
jgi:crotonobetainyl-CoA:carnitine CoA-transferase CaiB-like acyl-CoA transferase